MKDDTNTTTIGADQTDLFPWLVERLDALGSRIERNAGWIARPYLLAALLTVVSIVLASPDYRHFRPYAEKPWAEAALLWQSTHPLSPIPVDRFAAEAAPADAGIVEHLRKRSYRVTVPLIARLSGLGLRGMVVVQQVASYLLLLLTFLLLRAVFRDPVAAAMGSLALAASFFGQWGFNDFVYFDGIAYFLILLILWTRKALPIPFLLVAAGFVDERAVIAAPLIYLFQGDRIVGSFRVILAPNRRRIGTAAGVLLYLVARLALGLHYGVIADRSGISMMAVRYNLLILPLAMFLLYKGLAVFCGIAFCLLARWKAWNYTVVLVLFLLPGILAAMAVYDLSRSLGYGIPAVFICATIMARHLGQLNLRRVAACAAIASLIMPTYYILLGVKPLLPAFRFL